MRGETPEKLAWRLAQLVEVAKAVRRVVPLEFRKFAFRTALRLVDSAHKKIEEAFACAGYAAFGVDKTIEDPALYQSYRRRYAREYADKCAQAP